MGDTVRISAVEFVWKYVPAWISYQSRSQYLLQQDERVTDIGFLYNDLAIRSQPGHTDSAGI